jgi:hypothetical protein
MLVAKGTNEYLENRAGVGRLAAYILKLTETPRLLSD